MHELAIAESVISSVRGRTGDRPVHRVRVRVGSLTGVVPDALTFCFELAAVGTPLEGSVLEIELDQAAAHCRQCDDDFVVRDSILLCRCGSADVELRSGRDLVVASVEVG